MRVQSGQNVDLLIGGGIVMTMDAERRIYNPGYVAVRGAKIVEVGCGISPYLAEERLDASDMIVMPGLINAFNHLDQCVYRSCFEQPTSRDQLLRMARGLTRERACAAASLSFCATDGVRCLTNRRSLRGCVRRRPL